MSQFYDQASLVMVPSGYKSGKIYSQKPLSASGELSFSRASTATRVNASGLIESVASGVPRLDYSGGCPSLLLEPQRTNGITYSEKFDGTGWASQDSSISSNATTSPDGYTNADAIVEGSATSEHNRYQAPTLTAASYTASVFLKKYNATWCALYIYNPNGSKGIRHWINLDTLTAGTSANIGSGITAPMTLEDYGNGWVRASLTFTADATEWRFYIANAQSNGGTTSYAGDGTSGLYAWGAQLESGAYGTSYIPTLSSAVTRVFESASKTGISSLIGQTEGTFFAEFTIPESQIPSFFSISDGTGANRIILGYYSGSLRYYTDSATGSFSSNGVIDASPVVGQTYKIAIAYKANDFKVYKNGSNTNTETTYTVPASLTALDNTGGGVGQNIYATVKQLLLFKTRLSNADLATLTTL